MRFKNPLMRIGFQIFIVTMISGALLENANAQPGASELDPHGRWVNGISEPWWFGESISKEDIAAAQSQWTAIENENVGARGNIWAGSYFIGGDTHGSYLRWSPRNGFVLFHVDKCAASVMSFSYGKAVVSPYLIELIPEKTVAGREEHAHGVPVLTFLPVSWRNGRYLIPQAEIADFGDYVAGLGKYNDPNSIFIDYAVFFSKIDMDVPGRLDSLSAGGLDPRPRAAQSKPIVPPGYGRFIKKPIDARIVSRGKIYRRSNPDNEWWDHLIIPVTINAGSSIGLKEKMVLRIVDRPWVEGTDGVVTITKTYVGSSRGIIALPVRKRPCVKFSKDDDCKDFDHAPLSVGSRVTTNPFLEDSSQQ